MTLKGSIVIKKTDLINLIQNQKSIFRATKISTNSKHNAWGGQIAYERILQNGWTYYNWNSFMQSIFDYRGVNSWVAHGLRWLFQRSTPKVKT